MLPLGRFSISAPEHRTHFLAHTCDSSYKVSKQYDSVDHHANSSKVPENSQQKTVGHSAGSQLIVFNSPVSVKCGGVATTEETKTRSTLNNKIIVLILSKSFA